MANFSILQPVDIAGRFQQGLMTGRKMRAERVQGDAVNALLANPAAADAQIAELARLDPESAMQMVTLRDKQVDRQRQAQFRDASARYLGSGVNALMPSRPMTQPANTDVAPPVSDAPPPPANWREIVGPMGGSALQPSVGGFAGGRFSPDGQPIANPYGQPDNLQTEAIAPTPPMRATSREPVAQGQMPPAIARAAQSPDMGARNAAFEQMLKIDPVLAMKIDSEHRNAVLDRLEDMDKAYRIAIGRLPSVNDDAAYQALVGEMEAMLAPFGVNIRDSIPATYPGPEGTRELLMKALDAQGQLAAIDRRFSAEANVADDDADNARADRDVDSRITDRNARTGIARQRADATDRREARVGSGRKRGGRKAKGAVPTATNPATGERIEFRGGQWVPAR